MADENDELATKLTRAARRRRRCWWFPTKDLRRCRNPAPELFPLCSAHRKKFIRVLLATAGVVIVAAFVTEPVKRFVWREPKRLFTPLPGTKPSATSKLPYTPPNIPTVQDLYNTELSSAFGFSKHDELEGLHGSKNV